ncbi:MAG TPA: hypothetical protein VFO58_02450, partial [Vicinamibacterales bacterium]|nr:hypothetical protein [Vicinamibacterales bacterium]
MGQIGITTAVGLGDRVELFGSWRVVRLRRNVSPVFFPGDADHGGVINDFPFQDEHWSETLGEPIT